MMMRQTVVQRSEQDSGYGWRTAQQDVRVGSIFLDRVFYDPTDGLLLNVPLPLRDQLQALAAYLNDRTELGARPTPLLPSETGPDAVLVRYVAPMAYYYLQALPDLGNDDLSLILRLTTQLQQLIAQDVIRHRWQLALGGLLFDQAYEYRGVRLRPLTPMERAALAEPDLVSRRMRGLPGSDLVLPSSFAIALPSALLEITTERPPTQQYDRSTMPNAVALAFFLSGFEISGTGVIPNFDEPRWVTRGFAHTPFPLAERAISSEAPFSEREFKAVVDLAYKIPEFAGTEGNSRAVALFRALRALGMHYQESGFLDFAIALEAALLGGSQTELAYKFRLYGSLFLRDEFDSNETFERLKRDLRAALQPGARRAGQAG